MKNVLSKFQKTVAELCARDLMTLEIITLSINDELLVPNDLTPWRRFKTIPVVDSSQRLVGLVSYDALLSDDVLGINAVDPLHPKKIRVRDVMSSDFQTVNEDCPLAEVARALVKSRHGCLPVIHNETLIGVITSSDIARLLF